MSAIAVVLLIVCMILAWRYWGTRKAYQQEKVRYSQSLERITYFEQHFSEHLDAAEQLKKLQTEMRDAENEINSLKSAYKEKKLVYDQLKFEAAIYDETVQLAEYGFYRPHFSFDSSEQYKAKIVEIREQQKKMIQEKSAVICPIEWTVHNSKAEGRKMTNQGIRLATRAFNNECDAAIANTTWRNAKTMEQRILKAYETINKLNAVNQIKITDSYLNLKLQEFYLAHEYAEKRKQEQVERAELRAAEREEAKLERELQVAQQEEEKFKQMLEKAKREAEKATGGKLERLQEKINDLTEELAVAHAKTERALSMAQQTRAGYVYIISNIGSFGEGVYKLGMTRRLDPMDRIRELGDASVPFSFDVHALIYCDDAPALENMLHKEFADKRLNLRNLRREFFNVPLSDIEQVIKRKFPDAEFVETPEAQDYYESLAIRQEQEKRLIEESSFPDEI